MKTIQSLMMKSGAMLCCIAALFSCRPGTTSTEQTAESTAEQQTQQEDTWQMAIDRYLVDSIAPGYSQGEMCIPFTQVVATDESAPDSVLVWGSYWVMNYNTSGDTLKSVSGGNHAGLMHVSHDGGHWRVTAFDAVGDGSRFQPTAKQIFGPNFDAFMKIISDEKTREMVRKEAIADYVKQRGLNVTLYQDFGWEPIPIK